MSLKEKDIEKLEGMLLEQKEKLENELLIISKPSADTDDYEVAYENIGSDRDENATEVEEYVENVALENNLEEQLDGVNISLEKIKDGNFGICEECEEEIAIERLLVNPSAKKCIKCAEK